MTATKKSFLVILGARPNFVKAAPFFRRAKEYPDISLTLIHTGQHFDDNMSKIFFEQMNIPKPDIHLDVTGEYHTEKIGKMFSALKLIVSSQDFDGVIVFGDINSALAGAIAATSHSKKIIHVESGLRSHDRRMPEEINRAIIDHLSDVLFVTEESGLMNLEREGVPREKIHMVGNIMIESIEMFRSTFETSDILTELQLVPKEYVVATIHRQENTDDPIIFKKILNTLNEISRTRTVVMPLHPGTQEKVRRYGFEDTLNGLILTQPLGYIDFMKLIIDSSGVVTDSGGIQEETSHLGIPCCTLRDNTERPVTLTKGSNALFPLSSVSVGDIQAHLIRTDFRSNHIPLWDTEVSRRIFDVLCQL